jgi:geranylgeranyl diphosphate synthase type II
VEKNKLELRTKEVQDIIYTYAPAEEGFQKTIFTAMNYSFQAGGKRLRPLLMQETYRLFGGTGKVVEPFMAAIEMIHTYSLIHDDLPCMDDDEYRRGRLTNHKVFGEALALLAGDALLTLAFEVMLEQKNVPAEALIETVREVAMCAGNFGMVGGQVIDLDSEGRQKNCVSCMQAKQEHFSLRQFAVVRDCLVLPVMSCWL